MNDALAERIATALEQIALEMAQSGTTLPVAPSPAAQRFAPLGWVCPVHGSQKVVPAGVSARTGQPYSSFVACPEMGCNERPPRTAAPLPARALAPSQGGQMP